VLALQGVLVDNSGQAMVIYQRSARPRVGGAEPGGWHHEPMPIAFRGCDPAVPPGPARVFAFDEIVEADRIMDAGQAGGKLVVTLDGSAASYGWKGPLAGTS
jgi:hypothetical protein